MRRSSPCGIDAGHAELQARIAQELAQQGWIPAARVETKVRDGVVEFTGTIADARQRDALRAVAEAAGARDVREDLAYVNPLETAAFD